MSKGGFDYSGMRELFESTKEMMQKSDEFHRNFMNREGNRCLAETKRRTPVITGELRRKWFLRPAYKKGYTWKADIYSALHYASYVEHGHRLVPGLKFKTKDGQWRTTTQSGWWEGYHMAKKAIDYTQENLSARYERDFKSFANNCFK